MEDEKILVYNDDLEELRLLGPLKYVFYPFKIIGRKAREKLMFCKKRKDYKSD